MSDLVISPSAVRPWYYAALAATTLCAVLGLFFAISGSAGAGKLFATAGLLSGVTGTLCSAVRRFYSLSLEFYQDRPNGPPSHIVREMSAFEGEAGSLADKMSRIALSERAPLGFIIVGLAMGLPAIWL